MMRHWTTVFIVLPWLCAHTAATTNQPINAGRTECIGYYTLQLRSDMEYPLIYKSQHLSWSKTLDGPGDLRFNDDVTVLRNPYNVDSGGAPERASDIYITSEATPNDLAELLKLRNLDQQKAKNERIEMAKNLSDVPDSQKRVLKEAEEINLYKFFNNNSVIATQDNQALLLYALIGKRIVSAQRTVIGTPQQTIDSFLKNYTPRATFEVPNEPGVCLPYAFMRNEKTQADVGISFRLKAQPNVIFYVQDQPVDTSSDAPNAKAFMKKTFEKSRNFNGVVNVSPLDKFKPYHEITVDGRSGLAGFAKVTHRIGAGKDASNFIENWLHRLHSWR